MTTYRYEIDSRPTELGGGWRLRLFEDGQEAGGGVFPADREAEPQRGMAWFNALTEAERARWLATAKSARPVDAWGAYLSQEAFQEAQEEGENWVASRADA
ncbi:hypothetical protein [Cupriavidus sp. D39]|uniref:hypothetical protein n=1 Tax=Cupriavidus sp. D39 TaxID=2997877 RepID=UPI00227138F0|nr:hypothetical protein [Cupriavidus sp. D39]MCY0853091.1 hypothetical protein [Cupriavidus sp. D39]